MLAHHLGLENGVELPQFAQVCRMHRCRKEHRKLEFNLQTVGVYVYLCHHADQICFALPAPDNGRIVYSPDTTSPYSFATTATYICNSGYGLSGGTRTRNCGGDDSSPIGSWDGSAPLCIGKGALNTNTFH